ERACRPCGTRAFSSRPERHPAGTPETRSTTGRKPTSAWHPTECLTKRSCCTQPEGQPLQERYIQLSMVSPPIGTPAPKADSRNITSSGCCRLVKPIFLIDI